VEDLEPGEYWIVLDTWSDANGQEYPGPFSVSFEFLPDNEWAVIPLREGLNWERLRMVNGDYGDQTINLLRLDLTAGFDLQPHSHQGCRTVSSTRQQNGFFAGVNGGFFGGSCVTKDLLKADGVLYGTNQLNGFEQRSIGWSVLENLEFDWISPNLDWPGVDNAVGGYPSLVTSGTAFAEVYPGEQVYSATDWSNNPRTAVGKTADNELIMLTVDGRTSAGDGLTTPDLAHLMLELGAFDAFNLDGGGSTTMVIENCWINDVVNFPSDNSTADHDGERAVGSGLYVR
jgi:hypothetical protein